MGWPVWNSREDAPSTTYKNARSRERAFGGWAILDSNQ
jgi:hypothetical protein